MTHRVKWPVTHWVKWPVTNTVKWPVTHRVKWPVTYRVKWPVTHSILACGQGVQSVLLFLLFGSLSYFCPTVPLSYFSVFCPTFLLFWHFTLLYSTLFAEFPNSIVNLKNSPVAGLLILINCCSCQIFILYTNYSSENIKLNDWASWFIVNHENGAQPWKPLKTTKFKFVQKKLKQRFLGKIVEK